jgi:hypothetical protein
VSLLDYDYPRVHIRLYEGPSASAAEAVFEVYDERVREFADGPGDRRVWSDGANSLWTQVHYQTPLGPWITVTHVVSAADGRDSKMHYVRVEITGHDIECIEGAPEDSPWHIIFAGTTLQAKPRRTKPVALRKQRAGRSKGRRTD